MRRRPHWLRPAPCPELGFSWQYRKGSGLDIEAIWRVGRRVAGSLAETCLHHLQLGRQATSPLYSDPSVLDPEASSLLWGPAPVECLAVLGSALPYNTHVPLSDNGQGLASQADSPLGIGQASGGYPRPLWSPRQEIRQPPSSAGSRLQREERRNAVLCIASFLQREGTRKGLEGKAA